MKGVVAVDAAFQSAELGMNGIFIDDIHGINGSTPEETMRHMGEIASPGMTGTEKTIVDILQERAGRKGQTLGPLPAKIKRGCREIDSLKQGRL